MQEQKIKEFKRVLVANRGEIAIRVYRALNELGIQSIGIFSKEDKYSAFRTKADESYRLNPNKGPIDAYLDINEIIKIAKERNVDAIHPGYGFLSENPEFVEACEKNGITFIGPTVETMNAMGDKISSKQIAIKCGVPIIPGVDHALKSLEEVTQIAEKIGYPVMLKASNGGGGRGIRIVRSEDELESQIEAAKQEAQACFGNDEIYIEKFIENPKHIEIQILADEHGNVIHLGERDCSMQRRNQKVLEETPSPIMTEELRERMGKSAVDAAKACGYVNAGTIEFLVDKHGDYYFMEMNTRIQVEHPITEAVTGVDLVKEQLLIAMGKELSYKQEDIKLTGHAIECRINAENPKLNFRPSPGLIKSLHIPGGFGVRIDTAVYQGYEIPPYYDSMIGKLIVYAHTREEAIAKMTWALSEFIVDGVQTNIDFQLALIRSEGFIKGDYDNGYLSRAELKY